jgi:hypothetical protein
MDIMCVVIRGDFRIPCRDVRDPEDKPAECRREVEYVYKISNTCDSTLDPLCDTVMIDRFDMVRNGVLKDLMPIIPPRASLEPSETVFYVETGIEFDFCANKTVDVNIILTATTVSTSREVVYAAEAKKLFDIGFVRVPDKTCKVAIDLTCFVTDVQGAKTNCKDVPMPEDDEDCIKEVTYTYIVTNNGNPIGNIMSLDRTRDDEVKDLSDFLNVHDTPLGQFGVVRDTDNFDFCMPRIVTTSKSSSCTPCCFNHIDLQSNFISTANLPLQLLVLNPRPLELEILHALIRIPIHFQFISCATSMLKLTDSLTRTVTFKFHATSSSQTLVTFESQVASML